MKCLVVHVLMVFVLVNSQYQTNEKCKTPYGYNGTCTPISNCSPIIQPIIDASRKGNLTARKLAVAYQCGYEGGPLICCDDAVSTNGPETPLPLIPIRKPIVLKEFDSPDLPDRTICGVSTPEYDKITGGRVTELDEFPWTAAIEYVNKIHNTTAGVRCGGSLINNKWVVTAAHCISNLEFKISKVRLGEWNVNTNPDCYELDIPVANPDCVDNVQIFDVEKEVLHEYYTRENSNNDIGLLKLNGVVSYTDYIRPICLPPEGLPLPELKSYMTVAGWGLTENRTPSAIKLKVDVPLLSNAVCREKLPSRFISANHYCAGGELGKDACYGDSGGPLMRSFRNNPDDQEQWYLEGIVGSGIGCGLLGSPGIYIRVTQYTMWIIDKLSEDRQREGLNR